MPLAKFDPDRPRFARLKPGERYCMGDCGKPTKDMLFQDANGRMVCRKCAGKLAAPFGE